MAAAHGDEWQHIPLQSSEASVEAWTRMVGDGVVGRLGVDGEGTNQFRLRNRERRAFSFHITGLASATGPVSYVGPPLVKTWTPEAVNVDRGRRRRSREARRSVGVVHDSPPCPAGNGHTLTIKVVARPLLQVENFDDIEGIAYLEFSCS